MSKRTQSMPADTVLLRVSRTVQIDYGQRGVFSELCDQDAAQSFTGAISLFCVSQETAMKVQADAIERCSVATKYVLNAFNCYVKSISTALKEAEIRVRAMSGAEPVLYYQDTRREYWRGTKTQLAAKGISLPGAWPGEPGGPANWKATRDARGFEAHVHRYNPAWPTLFDAKIDVPPTETSDPPDKVHERAEDAQRLLSSMPTCEQDYKADLVHRMRSLTHVLLEYASEPSNSSGYRLDPAGFSDIHAAFDAVTEAVMNAPIRFDAGRHSKIQRGYRAQLAAADDSFQRAVVSLTSVNPSLLQGDQP